jgi:hypothetical protein
MNEIENTKQVRYGILILKRTLTDLRKSQLDIAKTTIKFTLKKTSGSSSTEFVFKHAFHTLFHG